MAPKSTKQNLIPPDSLLKDATVSTVDLKDIESEDHTFRYRLNLRVDRLAKDIDTNGQQVPVVLRSVAGRDRYQIISGFRRIQALNMLGAPKAMAIVLAEVSDEDAVKLSITENEQRKSYTDIERAYAVIKSRMQGLTYEKMSTLFTLSERHLRRLQTLTQLPARLQEAIEDGSLNATVALRLHSLSQKLPNFDLESWTQRAIDEQLSMRQLQKAVNEEHQAAKRKTALVSFDREAGEITIAVRKIKLEELDAEAKEELKAAFTNLLAELGGA